MEPLTLDIHAVSGEGAIRLIHHQAELYQRYCDWSGL